MLPYPYGSLIVGIMLTIAGICALVRHFLLEPVSLNYPKAPAWLRAVLFLFGATLIYVGSKFLWTFISGAPNTIPPQPSPYTQLLSIMVCAYKVAMLANILLQRYPAETWRRLQRIQDALCPKRKRRL